jgi:hypothetical protein
MVKGIKGSELLKRCLTTLIPQPHCHRLGLTTRINATSRELHAPQQLRRRSQPMAQSGDHTGLNAAPLIRVKRRKPVPSALATWMM